MKKFDWNHPVTRKNYAVAIVVAYWDNVKTWAKRKVEKIKSKLPWCD